MIRHGYRKPYRVKKRKSIFRSRVFWLSILVLITAGAIFYFLFLYSFFQVNEINISGNNKVRSEELRKIIAKEIEQNIVFFPTKSIFLTKPSKIKEIILNSFPQIAELNLKRKFPRILEIKIAERKPVAIFNANETYFFIDENGIVFEKIEKADLNFPLIKELAEDGSPSELGKGIIEKDLVSEIAAIFSELKNLEIPAENFLIVSEDRINVEISDGWEIYVNPQKNISWQLTKLKAVLEEGYIPSEYIELRFGDRAFVK